METEPNNTDYKELKGYSCPDCAKTMFKGIRHSRAVTEVVEKEGEAVIIWFKDLLGI